MSKIYGIVNVSVLCLQYGDRILNNLPTRAGKYKHTQWNICEYNEERIRLIRMMDKVI